MTALLYSRTAADLVRVLDVVRTAGTDIQTSAIQTFLLIAANLDITAREIQDRTEIASSTATRNIVILSEGRDRSEGYSLVWSETDVMDRRVKRLRLTPRGRQLMRQLEGILRRS